MSREWIWQGEWQRSREKMSLEGMKETEKWKCWWPEQAGAEWEPMAQDRCLAMPLLK